MGSYVALSELKSALGITVSTDDAFLNLAIDSAEQSIDDLCGRKFTADGSASARTYRAQPYICVTDDISTLTGLVVKTDTSGDGTYDTTWASTDIQTEPLNNLTKGRARSVNNLRAVGSYTFPVYGDGRAA
ncbi:MAG: phage head-tail connector protein, partial [Acidimicrobiales bacterium]